MFNSGDWLAISEYILFVSITTMIVFIFVEYMESKIK